MELILLDENFEALEILDTFESMLWIDRYCGAGEVEIISKASSIMIDLCKTDRYLMFKDSEHLMVIESRIFKSNTDNGDDLVIKGRSLESILDRRIITSNDVFTTHLPENSITAAIEMALELYVYPSSGKRVLLPNITYTVDSSVAALGIGVLGFYDKWLGKNLYTFITEECLARNIGYKLIRNDSGIYTFTAYAGVNRSYSQTTNPYVVFSPEFGNFVGSEYTEDITTLKNVSYVIGTGEPSSAQARVLVYNPAEPEGLLRREISTDGSSITVPEGGITDPDYLVAMGQKGKNDLSLNILTKNFESEIDATRMFIYGTDFFMGDIVQVVDKYGNQAKYKVTEMIYSQDGSGIKVNPTFSAVV